MNQREIRRVLRKYGFVARQIKTYDSHYARGVAFRVGTRRGDVAVKPFRGSSRRLSAICMRVQRLRKLGFCHMPRWYHTTSGRPWVTSHDQVIYVTEWIEGQQLGERVNDYGLLGGALGSLHRRTTIHTSSLKQVAWNKLLGDFQRCEVLLRDLNAQKIGKLLGTWYENAYHDIIKLSGSAWSEMRNLIQKQGESLRLSLIHGDVTVPNVIIQDNKAVLIDFEQLKYGFSTIELAKVLANTTGFKTKNMRALLKSYEKQFPLTPLERKLLLASYSIPREFYTSIKQAQKKGGTPQIATIFRSSWSERLEAIAWLKNWCQIR